MGAPAVNLPPDELATARETAATALTLPDQARALAIVDAESYHAAAAFLVEIKGRRKAIVDAFAPVVAAGLRAHREALALQKKADGPAELAENEIKTKMGVWFQAQERLRLEAERKAAEERRRLEAEARAAAELARREAEDAAERQRIADAEAALEAGDDARAELILDAPPVAVVLPEPAPFVPPPVEVVPVVKAAGVSFKKVYRHAIVNAAAIKREFLCPDEKKIAAMVRALGPDAVATVGGIAVHEDLTVSARAR
jgi:hypothetical protein